MGQTLQSLLRSRYELIAWAIHSTSFIAPSSILLYVSKLPI